MDKIELLSKLSSIARIEVRESSQDQLASKITNIIKWSSKIQQIDTGGVEPMFSVLEWQGFHNTNLREDVITSEDNSKAILNNAPDIEDEFIAVPKIIE